MKFRIGERFYIPYKSEEDIPLDEFKNLHKQYWTFIAHFGLDNKPRIFSSITKSDFDFPTINWARCFACAYAIRINCDCKCVCCPIKKYRSEKEGIDVTKCLNIPPFLLWSNFGNSVTENKKLALQIANLKWEDMHNEMD